MKPKLFKTVILTLFVTLFSLNVSAFDIKSALGSVIGSDSTQTQSGIGSIIGAVLGTDKVVYSDLVGTWKYSAPAVSFKSDNLLQKAGGAAAASTIEEKLLPIYSQTGITGLTLDMEADSTFTMTVKKVKTTGTITLDEDGNYLFSFTALGKSIYTATAYVTKTSSSEISLTFDASKLISLIETVAKVSNNSTLKTASALLNSYDGVTVGFKLKK